MAQEIEETLKRILNHKGVEGLIILNREGLPVNSSLDSTTSLTYARHIHSLILKARAVIKEIDLTNDLKFLQVISKKHQIIVASEQGYSIIVIQKETN